LIGDAGDASGATAARIDGARGYADLFQIVKEVVQRHVGKSRAGIMLALSRLGLSPEGYLGGYFVLGSNAIVLNRDVLDYVRATQPEYLNAYAFHVLLHEYLHTLGYIPEDEVRPLANALSAKALGARHPASVIAAAMDPTAPKISIREEEKGSGSDASAEESGEDTDMISPDFLRKLVYPPFGWAPARDAPIEIVKGFDLDASPYIA
jgi:hypothetical protein